MSTASLIGIWSTAVLGYLIIAGGVWCLFPARDRDYSAVPGLTAVYWPVTVPVWLAWIVCSAAFLAPSYLVEWHRNRRQQLPIARIRTR